MRLLGVLKRRLVRAALLAWSVSYCAFRGIERGAGTVIYPGARIARGGGRIRLGRNCEIHPGAQLLAYGGSILLGDDVSVNPYSVLYGHGGLKIGEGCRIAAHVVIIPANHGTRAGRPIRQQPLSRMGIDIGPDVWIGAGARILDGVTVASGCIVASGAVVTPKLQSVPEAILGGIPARQIGSRTRDDDVG